MESDDFEKAANSRVKIVEAQKEEVLIVFTKLRTTVETVRRAKSRFVFIVIILFLLLDVLVTWVAVGPMRITCKGTARLVNIYRSWDVVLPSRGLRFSSNAYTELKRFSQIEKLSTLNGILDMLLNIFISQKK